MTPPLRPQHSDRGSLAFGLLFLGMTGWWLFAQVADLSVSLAALGWLVAGLLVAVGVVGVLSAIRSGRQPDRID